MSFSGQFYRFFKEIWAEDNSQKADTLALENSIENALLLIMAASETAVSLDKGTINCVVEIKHALKSGTITTDQETEFWIAYQVITQAVFPITIDTVRATYERDKDQKPGLFFLSRRKYIPLSRRCASNYKLISILTLSLLIGIQIYWYIGWSIMEDIEIQTQTIQELEEELTAINLQESSTKINDATKNIQHAQIEELIEEIREHREWKNAAFHHLKNWNQTWSSLDLITLQPWQEEAFETYSLAVQRHIEFVAAGNFLAAIVGYVLPILYGMIGACFFILRQLPKEIEERTFSINSYIGYNLRMAQGPLAGILVSYFFSADQPNTLHITKNSSELISLDPSLGSLSSLAIAFLAGYSVEFIFRFLDKALNNPPRDNPPDVSYPPPKPVSQASNFRKKDEENSK